ncbi:MAG: hypothetical protein FD161_1196 [Limisphaerales bacterium]|nr:MAG: hypothetical protein FD161_1196 [Limisphaerales bacterium]TXT49466.1 MAG: hypothetical protein FD140_2998 [Limisphaerales bacterium]
MNQPLPFTRAQWDALNPDEQAAVAAVHEQLIGLPPPEGAALTDEHLSTALRLLRPLTEAILPDEENDGDVTGGVQRKFHTIHDAARRLAEARLAQFPGRPPRLRMLVETDAQDHTRVVVFDEDSQRLLFHENNDAAEFQFADLRAIAVKVLAMRDALVAAARRERIIHVVVQGGLVQEVTDVPPGIGVQVVDYDVDRAGREHITRSPLDGEPCVLTKF